MEEWGGDGRKHLCLFRNTNPNLSYLGLLCYLFLHFYDKTLMKILSLSFIHMTSYFKNLNH